MQISKLAYFLSFLALLLAQNSYSQSSAPDLGFDPAPLGYKVVEEYLVENMPPVRQQGRLPICGAFSSAAMVEFEICRQRNQSCATLNAQQRPSLLGMALLTNAASSTDRSNFREYRRSLKIVDGSEYTFGLDALLDLMLTQEVMKESCNPIDTLVPQRKSESGGTGAAALERFKIINSFYTEWHRKAKQDIYPSRREIENSLGGLNVSEEELFASLKLDDFGDFIFNFATPKKCFRKAEESLTFLRLGRDVQLWPHEDEMLSANPQDGLKFIKALTQAGRPIMVDKFCTNIQLTANCKNHDGTPGGHGFLVTGYRKICAANSCEEVVRVHNSWGQEWQDKYNGGWVRVEPLLKRTQAQYGSLVWFSYDSDKYPILYRQRKK